MLEDRNIKYPSWVLAALLGYVAFVEITHALALMQVPNGSAGWIVELLTTAICAVLGTLMLMRPHLWFFVAAAVWALFAFLANFVMKAKGVDSIAVERMSFYFIIFVAASVVAGIEGWKWYLAEKAKRPANPWAGGWPGQYPGAPMPGPSGQWGQPGFAPQQPPPPPPPMQPAPPAPPAP